MERRFYKIISHNIFCHIDTSCMLAQIKGNVIEYSKTKRKKRNEREVNISKYVDTLKDKLQTEM